MSDKKLFRAWINPLVFLEVDEPWAQAVKREVTLESIISYMCAPGLKADVSSMVDRYKEITTGSMNLFAAPAEEHILTRLVWPLRHAKACYMVGNYLGTISLCGMVAEMTAILLFEISNISINGKELTREVEVKLFGSEFEKLGQERRIDILSSYNLIDSKLEENLDLIRTKRRRYLHIFSQEHTDLAQDAVAVFKVTVEVVVKIIGQDIQNGKVLLNPAILKYLEKHNVLESENVDQGAVPGSPA